MGNRHRMPPVYEHYTTVCTISVSQILLIFTAKEHWYRGEADSSTTKLYSDNSLKSVFSTKTITVEFGCSKANRPKVLADLSADIVFAYTYMLALTDQNFLRGLCQC